jgi:RNA polymerase sigma-70 factor, ECF subfamily
MKKENSQPHIFRQKAEDRPDAIASAFRRKQIRRETLFSELFREHYTQLFSGVYVLIRNYTDAEDVMQQASVVMWSKFDEYREETNFVAWAFSVARFEALNFLKRERRYRKHFSEAFQMRLAATLAGVHAETADVRNDLLKKCVEKLPESQRDLLNACYGDDATIAEVAEDLGRSTHSVYSSLRNIREKLLDCVDENMSQEKPRSDL